MATTNTFSLDSHLICTVLRNPLTPPKALTPPEMIAIEGFQLQRKRTAVNRLLKTPKKERRQEKVVYGTLVCVTVKVCVRIKKKLKFLVSVFFYFTTTNYALKDRLGGLVQNGSSAYNA